MTPRPLQDCLLLEGADRDWMSRLLEGLEDDLRGDPKATTRRHQDIIALTATAAVLFGLALLTTRWRAPLVAFGGNRAAAPSLDD